MYPTSTSSQSVGSVIAQADALNNRFVTVEGSFAGNISVDQTFIPGQPDAPRRAWFPLKDLKGNSTLFVETSFRQRLYSNDPDDINLGEKVFGLDKAALSGKTLFFSGRMIDGRLHVEPSEVNPTTIR